MRLAAALLFAAALCLAPAGARADDTRAGAPHRVAMPERVLRAVAHRPRVSVAPRQAAPMVSRERPAPRATFVDRITRSVNDGESF